MRNAAVVILVVLGAAGARAGSGVELAEEQYQRTDYKGALSTLAAVSPKGGAVYALLGKASYMDGQYKSAVGYLEKAVSEDPRNSGYYDWLGKAYGRRAEESNFLNAYSYANKTRAAFERAVELDATNLEALGDLFEYYLEAPGVVGGGTAKAEAIAARMGRLNEAEYHYVSARVAEKRKDFGAAEQELRKAMQLEPERLGRVIDVARFLAKRGRYEESDGLFRQAAQMAPDSPRLMFARAAAYIESRRNTEQAKTLLQQYAAASLTPDDPPRSEVAKLLARAR